MNALLSGSGHLIVIDVTGSLSGRTLTVERVYTSMRRFDRLAPGKRMLSSMTPVIVMKAGKPVLVTGSPGGRTIINTVLLTILNVIDFGMNVQEAVDAPRFHHQWLPDSVQYERNGLSPDTVALLRARGHVLREISAQGIVEAIIFNQRENWLEGGTDRRAADGGVAARQ